MEQSTRRFRLTAVFVTLVALYMIAFTVPASAAVPGGWSVSKVRYSFLTSGQKKTFKKATKKLTGVSYKPVALLAKQTVAGTKYVFLCQGTTATRKPVRAWYVLTAVKDLKNKVTLSSVRKIKVGSIKTQENPRTQTLDGGLQIVAVKNKSAALSGSVLKIFKKGIQKYVGYELRPVALLGTQTVAGNKYRVLCYGTGQAGSDYFVVDIYKDLKGNCSVSACDPLDLEKYAG